MAKYQCEGAAVFKFRYRVDILTTKLQC